MCAKKKTRRRKYRKKNNHSGFNHKFTRGTVVILLLIIAVSFAFIYLEEGLHGIRNKREGNNRVKLDLTNVTDLHIPRYRTPRGEQIIKHTGFTVSYSEKHRQPNWVGYELTVDKTRGEHERTNRFICDPHVTGASAHTSDYSKSGFDRGHMVPAADMKWHKQAMEESFYLSNICPQHPDLNQQSWKVLEDRARGWAISDSAIVIVCGPIIRDRCRKIGNNKVSIPDGFFKVILSPHVSPPQAIGFLFKNKKYVGSLREYAVPVDSVEVITGLDFFHQLPDSIESVIEASINIAYWELQ